MELLEDRKEELKHLIKGLIDLEYSDKLPFKNKPVRDNPIDYDDHILLQQELENSINIDMFLSRL